MSSTFIKENAKNADHKVKLGKLTWFKYYDGIELFKRGPRKARLRSSLTRYRVALATHK